MNRIIEKKIGIIGLSLVLISLSALPLLAFSDDQKTFNSSEQPAQQSSPQLNVIEITMPDGSKQKGFIKDGQFIRVGSDPINSPSTTQQPHNTLQVNIQGRKFDPLAPTFDEFYTPYSFHYPGLFAASKNENLEKSRAAYWKARQLTFDKEIAACKASTGDKATCYMQVRQFETQKTQRYRDDINTMNQNQNQQAALRNYNMQQSLNRQAAFQNSMMQQLNSPLPESHMVTTHCNPSFGGQFNCTSY